eukprot:5921834-Ditylum_brightwellii.AAC.1
MDRSKHNKHVVCNKDDNGDNDVDNVADGVDGADKRLTHLLQAADCCLMQIRKQNRHVIC